jgi:hypothetical protein
VGLAPAVRQTAGAWILPCQGWYSISVEGLWLLVWIPTAHRPPPGIAEMPAKPLSPFGPGFGLETTDHWPPTPCSAIVSWLPVFGSMYHPAAQVEPSAAVVAANRSFSPAPTLGAQTTLQVPPLYCSTRARWAYSALI